MKTLFLDRLKISHICFGILCCLLLYWLLKGHKLKPSDTWQPKAKLLYRQDKTNWSKHVAATRIPKIIHQTWKDYNIPELISPWVKKCIDLHDDYEYWFWTDEDIRALVAEIYPQYLRLFDSYPANAYRADAFRYFVLYEYGGIYLDLDMECVKPLTQVIDEHSCILSQEPREHAHFLSPTGIPMVSNALMACRRGHLFFEHVIEDLTSHCGWVVWNDILRATGPYMLTEEYLHFTKEGLFFASDSSKDELYLADPEEFHPTTDPSMRDHMREACIHSQGHTFLNDKKYLETQEELCAGILKSGFREEVAGNSYTDHHWTHTWAGERNDPYNIIGANVYVDVKTLMSEKKGQSNLKTKGEIKVTVYSK